MKLFVFVEGWIGYNPDTRTVERRGDRYREATPEEVRAVYFDQWKDRLHVAEPPQDVRMDPAAPGSDRQMVTAFIVAESEQDLRDRLRRAVYAAISERCAADEDPSAMARGARIATTAILTEFGIHELKDPAYRTPTWDDVRSDVAGLAGGPRVPYSTSMGPPGSYWTPSGWVSSGPHPLKVDAIDPPERSVQRKLYMGIPVVEAPGLDPDVGWCLLSTEWQEPVDSAGGESGNGG